MTLLVMGTPLGHQQGLHFMLPKAYRYIKWYLTDIETVDNAFIEAKVKKLIKHGGVDVTSSKSKREDWNENEISYHLDRKKNSCILYVKENDKFKRYIAKLESSTEDITPAMCGTELRKVFTEKTGVTLKKAFGTTSSNDIRLCCPKPLYYINKGFCNITLDNVSGIDVVSMYPACVRGNLPDAHTAIEVNGRVEPSEEYPFAFYLKSHHCAEYGVFDTHEYMSIYFDAELNKWLCYNSLKKCCMYNIIDDEDEVTVLMKPSSYSFDTTMETFMERKMNGDPLAKAVMNIGLGTLHKNPDRQRGMKKGEEIQSYYHFCAIMQGRANAMQLRTMKDIKEHKGIVIQAIVDSIIYIDNCKVDYGTTEKVFGQYHLDYKKHQFRMANIINRYVVSDGKEIVKVRLSGDFDKETIKKLEDIDQFNSKGE